MELLEIRCGAHPEAFIMRDTTINTTAFAAATDDRKREDLIISQEKTILRTASLACRRFVSRQDDEWSVALSAFNKAIDSYDDSKGDFLPFAKMLIRRALIDDFRSRKDVLREVPVAPHVMEGNGEPGEDADGVYLAVISASTAVASTGLRDEILAINEKMGEFGFRFYDLTECSPRQEKTKRDCADAIRLILSSPALLLELEKTHKLPIKSLSASSGIPRKTLDRYRKYLIMAVLVLNGDYPFLQEYLKFMKEESRK